MILKAFLTGLMWAGIEEFLHKEAFYNNVDITFTKTIGKIRKTYFYIVEGKTENVNSFRKSVHRSVKHYNNE